MAAEAKATVYIASGAIKVKQSVAEVKAKLEANLNNAGGLIELEQEYESEKYAAVYLKPGEIVGVGSIAVGNYFI